MRLEGERAGGLGIDHWRERDGYYIMVFPEAHYVKKALYHGLSCVVYPQ